MTTDKNNAAPDPQPAELAEQQVDALRERTPADFAIEHAGYLANASTRLLKACGELDSLVMRRDEHDDVDDSGMHAAQDRVDEASDSVRSAIYEFEKRRDRALAATGKQQVGENPAWRDELVREAHARGLMEGLNSPRPQQDGELQGDALYIEWLKERISSIYSTVSLGHQTGPYAYAGEDFSRYLTEAASDCRKIMRVLSALAAQPSPAGQGAVPCATSASHALRVAYRHLDMVSMRVSHCKDAAIIESAMKDVDTFDLNAAISALADRQPGAQTFQGGVSEWMGQCFLPSLYSNMTERGDRLLEEVLELLQAHGYDQGRVATLVDYVFGRPVGDPAQEVGGVMVTLAGYCWVTGLDMHAAGDAELRRITQPEVMAKIRRKQEAKNALHFDTPVPGNAAPPAQGIDLVPRPMDTAPRDGTMVRLLVQFTEHATEDTDGPSWTIGANNGEHDGGDLWCFAGWCWTHDHFTEGKGTPVGWLPLIDDQRDAAPGVGNGPTCKDPLQVASCRMEKGNG